MRKTELYPGIWRLSFDWKKNPGAKTSEIYVVNGRKQSLVVDTSKEEIVSPRELARAVLRTGASPDNIAIFLTHYHLDHSGNARALSELGIPVIGSVMDPMLPEGESREWYFSRVSGIPTEEQDDNVMRYYEVSFPEKGSLPPILHVRNGDEIDCDPWCFKVIKTPGHSLDSCCLFEARTGLLIAGDTLMSRIIPPINTTMLDKGQIGKYGKTLALLEKLPVTMSLPGHHDPLVGAKAHLDRIKVIRSVYSRRIARVNSILKGSSQELTAFEVNGRCMTHEIDASKVSPFYKVTHVSMMLGYLEHLFCRGIALRKVIDGTAYYASTRSRLL